MMRDATSADAPFVERQIRALRLWEPRADESTCSITGSGAIAAFEREFPRILGKTRGLCLSSGTMALRVALQVLGVHAGDEVVVPAYDWVAAATAVTSLGAVPVAADVLLPDCGLDPDAICDAVAPKTKCVVVTHLFGAPAELPAIKSVCDSLGLPLVEDCSQAVGACIDGQAVGASGLIAVTSLGKGKVVDGEEGGFFAADDRALWLRALELSQHPLRQLLAGVVVPNLMALPARIHPTAAVSALVDLDEVEGRLTTQARVHRHIVSLLDQKGFALPRGVVRGRCAGRALPAQGNFRALADWLMARGIARHPAAQHLVAGHHAERRAPTPCADQVDEVVQLFSLATWPLVENTEGDGVTEREDEHMVRVRRPT